MSDHDFAALEGIEFAASADLYRAASDAAVEVRELGGATCLHCRGIEPAVLFRRVVGLGVGRVASETGLDEALAHMNGRGGRFAVTADKPSNSYRNILRAGFEEQYLRQNYMSPA